jgi:hypothetical protein
MIPFEVVGEREEAKGRTKGRGMGSNKGRKRVKGGS